MSENRQIHILWTFDESSCEDCGPSYADGAIVSINGKVALDLAPCASCVDSISYSREDVYQKILEHLGYHLMVAPALHEPVTVTASSGCVFNDLDVPCENLDCEICH